MKRVTGALLVLAASILYCCPYICASIYLQGLSEYSFESFRQGIEWVGGAFKALSILLFVAGVGYLVYAEITDRKKDQ